MKPNLGLVALSFLLAWGCSSLSYWSPGPYFGAPIVGSGTYLQEVKIQPKEGESYRFKCVFQKKKESALVSALSFSGQTVFRVLDTLRPSASPKVKIFPSELEARGQELSAFYEGFRALLVLEHKPSKPDPIVKSVYPDQRPRTLVLAPGTELLVREYDWEGRARLLTLTTPQFTADVTLREYTPEQD